jgi:hypothetical protein
VADKTTKRIFADVSIDTANAFLAKARLEGTTGQALIDTWVSQYLGGKRDTTPDSERKWMDKLEYILQHGDASTRAVVTANLSLFEKIANLHGKK